MREVAPLGSARLDIGRRFRIVQPRLKPMVWTVTRLHPGKSFSWQAGTLGVVITARHEIETEDAGSSVRLTLEFEGLLGGILARLMRRTNLRYLRMEAEGLKMRCEHDATGSENPAIASTEQSQ